jgi:2-C-methyl-D-erythritol 4-phosphate cytidylyltransferase
MAAHGRKTVAAILVAGGSGVRLGADVPKAFCLVNDRTLLEYALVPFRALDQLVVVAPAAELDRARALCGAQVQVVAGGATRQQSVRSGLHVTDAEFVLVHDVARPFVPVEVIDRVIAALMAGADAVIPARPVVDTIKAVAPDGSVGATIDRSQLRAVQTPQGFRRSLLVKVHDRAPDRQATDDAGLVEEAGGRVVFVDGADAAFKITHPWDLLVAAAIAPDERIAP